MAAEYLIVTETKFNTTIQSIDRDFYPEARSLSIGLLKQFQNTTVRFRAAVLPQSGARFFQASMESG